MTLSIPNQLVKTKGKSSWEGPHAKHCLFLSEGPKTEVFLGIRKICVQNGRDDLMCIWNIMTVTIPFLYLPGFIHFFGMVGHYENHQSK